MNNINQLFHIYILMLKIVLNQCHCMLLHFEEKCTVSSLILKVLLGCHCWGNYSLHFLQDQIYVTGQVESHRRQGQVRSGHIVKNLSQHMISIHKIKKRIKNPIVIDEGCRSSNQKKTTSDDQPQSNSPMPNDIQILLGLSPSLMDQRIKTGSPTSNSNPTSNNDPTTDAGSQKPEGHFIVLNVEHIKMWKDILEKYVFIHVFVTKTTLVMWQKKCLMFLN